MFKSICQAEKHPKNEVVNSLFVSDFAKKQKQGNH